MPAFHRAPLCSSLQRLDLAACRPVILDAPDPATRWSAITRADDVDDMRHLARAVMGDIRRKPLWHAAWRAATGAAYHAFYRPFGHHVDESDYLAALIGRDVLTRRDLAGLQRLYTLCHAGCSAVMAWCPVAGRMIHFRSLDWPSAPAIARASRIYKGHVAGKESFSAIGILGMVGFLTAVKPGFSVAINFAPWRGPSLSLNTDPTFLIRQLMVSGVSTYAEACTQISGWRPGAPVFISVCGITKGEACIFEFGARGRPHAIPMGTRDYLVQTNHFSPAGPFARHAKPQAPDSAWDKGIWDDYSILQTSQARWRLLDECLSRMPWNGLDTILETAFASSPVWNHETAQWVRMEPETGDIRAWVRAP